MTLVEKAILATLGAAAGIAIIVAIGRRTSGSTTPSADDPPEDEPADEPGGSNVGKFQNNEKPIAVGEATDPKVAPLLAEIRQLWMSYGIRPDVIVPEQFYTMTKAPKDDGPDEDNIASPILAIAPRATWQRTAGFIGAHVQPIVLAYRDGDPSRNDDLRFGGYRPADYNDAVGGAENSRHVDGDAADIWLKGSAMTRPNKQRLFLLAAKHVIDHPKDPIGFGAYTWDVHVDIGGRRTWERGDEWIHRAKNLEKIS